VTFFKCPGITLKEIKAVLKPVTQRVKCRQPSTNGLKLEKCGDLLVWISVLKNNSDHDILDS
jgi:hypothetical protein